MLHSNNVWKLLIRAPTLPLSWGVVFLSNELFELVLQVLDRFDEYKGVGEILTVLSTYLLLEGWWKGRISTLQTIVHADLVINIPLMLSL